MSFKVDEHCLVPKHIKLEKEEAGEVLKKYNISKIQLPKISKKDPAIKEMGLEIGNIVKIMRSSETAGQIVYYRVVVS
jgi:DNA-directed RNA polymerase subunit H